ncbi:L-2-hydroxyglutarate oxidase LhgO [Williamsia limnetica]|uniref:L-2-hydroxyglutarate oxidase LhgO n=1 Tax=Williamsia limnetica TaxID=882452 RepID=A0A318RR84_WILLI|nr:NAD(P)/FAD-dependent oxidoreductase [Williamsia limnetica]PYE17926.1 L-2-hydroxyglutarate oxidase LhgO [Williamsia limnetica]
MAETLDCLVIGAGVIGLAVARELALRGREVVIVDAEDAIGTQTSSRNSEVIHAGIYYPVGSAKAQLCVRGRELLYDYCSERSVEHRRLGKLIVATDYGQVAELTAIKARAAANGVHDLRRVEAAELADLEPDLVALEALLSPSTGIVDSHGLMASLHRDAGDAGAATVLRTTVTSGRVVDGLPEIDLDGTPVRCGTVINCAGLGAWDVAQAITGYPVDRIPRRVLAKGNYYSLTHGRAPFSHLVYPVPAGGGLGVHLTLDLAGQARFGPDVEWIEAVDYTVDAGRADAFYAEIRKYWPGLPDEALSPAYSGIRPKLSGRGEPNADFMIQGSSDHGIVGLINLFGFESPGLTSCLAIAEVVGSLSADQAL